MKSERIAWVVAIAVAAALTTVGCDSGAKSSTTATSTTATSNPNAQPNNAPAVPDMAAALSGKKDAAGPATPETGLGDEATEEVQEERQVAVAGVGKKGSRYGGGIITEPVSQYFGVRERITFMSIQKAMRTFQAMHDRLPDSHEEFMEKIVEENGLELPGLFDDERYEYDADAGELMVVRPKKK